MTLHGYACMKPLMTRMCRVEVQLLLTGMPGPHLAVHLTAKDWICNGHILMLRGIGELV